jgi:lysophospholipase L1-like esterase
MTRPLVGGALLALLATAFAFGIAELGVRALWARTYPEPSVWINHRVLGQYRRPSFRFRVPQIEGYQGDIQTDADGTIVRASLSPESADRSVMFLGDSMLEGQLIAPDDNLSEVVARRLRTATGHVCRCVNLGASVYSPARYLLAFRYWQAHVLPDVAIVFLYVLNDFNDDARLFHDDRLVFDGTGRLTAVRPTFDCRRGLQWRHDVGIQPMPRRENMTDCGGLVTDQLLRRTLAAYFARTGPLGTKLRTSTYATAETDLVRDNVLSVFKAHFTAEDRANLARTFDWIEEAHHRARAARTKFLVVILPAAVQVPGELTAEVAAAFGVPEGLTLSDRPQRWIASELDARGIPALDVLPDLLRLGPGVAFGRRDKHFSVAGHRVVGDAVAARLLDMERRDR